MISHIAGQVIHKDIGWIIVETGGIGYKIHTTGDTVNEIANLIDKPVSLWTHQAIREDSSDLYGFMMREELEFFELLISISGIGPKTGLAVLNASSIENLKMAISTGETSHLTKISGIGKKLANKIVFELKDKVGEAGGECAARQMQGDTDLLEALISLGYGERESREAIKKLPKDISGTSNRVKATLKVLGK